MKNLPVEITAPARLNLLDIWNYLAEHASIDVADKVLSDIKDAFQTIRQIPGIGHLRQDLTKRKLRFYRVHSYYIAYSHEAGIIRISRVVHGARDILTQLEE